MLLGLRWPASEKRQGTKSREVVRRSGSERYGDFGEHLGSQTELPIAPPLFSRLVTGPSAHGPRSGLERSDFVLWPIAPFGEWSGIGAKREWTARATDDPRRTIGHLLQLPVSRFCTFAVADPAATGGHA